MLRSVSHYLENCSLLPKFYYKYIEQVFIVVNQKFCLDDFSLAVFTQILYSLTFQMDRRWFMDFQGCCVVR